MHNLEGTSDSDPSCFESPFTNERLVVTMQEAAEGFFGETLLDGTKSKRGNKYAEAFVTNFGLSRAFPLANKGDAHEDLSLFFQRDGVPPKMIVEGSKEQTMGNFKLKVAEAGCHLRHTEPESPWQIAEERIISELKRGSVRKMTKMK